MKGSQKVPGERAIRVLVADSSRIHTFLVADALRLDPLLDVIPFEADSCEMVAAVRAQKIDVLVISSSLDERPARGFEVLHELRGAQLSTRAVLLPDSSRDEAVLKAFRGGARGVFSKSEPIEQLSKCVRCVHQGQIWANSEALRVAVEALASSPTVRAVNADGMKLLSDRELQVVQCIAEGLSNREIAERLKLSQHTIKNYLFRIFDKVGVSSRVELLFMTLSQTGEGQALLRGTSKRNVNHVEFSSEESALLKDAESGLPAAQLALAQLYLDRGDDPEGVVNGYMWYLVATERAFNVRGSIAKLMTPEQIEEAKQKASVWLSKLMQTPIGVAASKLDSAPPKLPGDLIHLRPSD